MLTLNPLKALLEISRLKSKNKLVVLKPICAPDVELVLRAVR